MEYNDLITRVKQAPIDTPDADAIMQSVHHALHRRQRQHQWIVSMSFVLVVGAVIALLPQTTAPDIQPITLAEQVSQERNTPNTNIPAPIVGYRHSIRNIQINTIL